MKDHFNQLSPGELERLAILAEECAEVIQIIGKVVRHGYESYNPFDPLRVTNRTLLAKEIGHLEYSIRLLISEGDISNTKVDKAKTLKAADIKKYLHHQP